MPASFFPASGTLLQLHIYASRCINMHRHTLILRVFAGEGVSAAVYASLTQMTPTALLSANYATPAVLTRLFSLTEEPVWYRRKGFSAPSPSLFRHAAEALPQPRNNAIRAFPHASRSAAHLHQGHERAEKGLPAFCFAILFCQKRVMRKAYFYAFPPFPAHLRRCVRACRSGATARCPPCDMGADGRRADKETALSREESGGQNHITSLWQDSGTVSATASPRHANILKKRLIKSIPPHACAEKQ
jgi:hypothetical protein